MGYFADIYIIKKTRSKAAGLYFINHFLPYREERAACYEVPLYGKEVLLEFKVAEDLMDYLEEHPTVPHRVSWSNLDPEHPNKFGMLFYTKDGYLIFGLSRELNPYEDFEDKSKQKQCLEEMKAFFRTKEGYITYNCPPEDTYEEFMQLVEHSP